MCEKVPTCRAVYGLVPYQREPVRFDSKETALAYGVVDTWPAPPIPKYTGSAVFELDVPSREVHNHVPRDPFERKTDRREFPFHLESSNENR